MSRLTIVEGNSNDKNNVRVIMVKGEKGEKGDNGEIAYNDVVDDLNSTETQKPLSANQGRILKGIIDNRTFHQITTLQEGLNHMGNVSGYTTNINVTTSQHYVNGNVSFYNTNFTSDLTDFIVLENGTAGDNTIIKFINCNFNKMGLQLYQKGNYIFENCTFINQIRSAINLNNSNQTIVIKNCIFKDTKPNVDEWIANLNNVQSWKYNPINIYGENADITISHCKFINIMAGACVYKPSTIENLNINFDNNYINNTCNSALTFETGSSGNIYNNTFLNIGGLKNTGGYTTTVTGVGMVAMYCIGIGTLNVYNNYIENVGENGIEGTYSVIKNNIIKNTGYRYIEGYTTPSTEGIYANAKEISGNTIYNTYTNGIVISGSISSINEINVCNNQAYGNNNGYGIIINTNTNTINAKINISNNICNNYISVCRVINNNNLTYSDLTISNNSCLKIFNHGFGELRGVNYKNNNKIAELKNINFINVTNNNVDDWNSSAGTLTRENDTETYYGKFVAANQYANMHQDCQLSGDKYLAVFHLIAKSTADFKLSALSYNPSDTVYSTDAYEVYSGFQVQFTASETYKDYYYCAIVRGKASCYLYLPTTNAEIDFKLFNVEFYPLNI